MFIYDKIYKMRWLYKYLYYRLYSWNLKKWGEKDLPQWNALLGVSFMMFQNLFVMILLLQYLGINIPLPQKIPVMEIIVLMAGFFAVNYFWFIRKNKFYRIAVEFNREDARKRKKRTLLLWTYFVLSFVLLTCLAINT